MKIFLMINLFFQVFLTNASEKNSESLLVNWLEDNFKNNIIPLILFKDSQNLLTQSRIQIENNSNSSECATLGSNVAHYETGVDIKKFQNQLFLFVNLKCLTEKDKAHFASKNNFLLDTKFQKELWQVLIKNFVNQNKIDLNQFKQLNFTCDLKKLNCLEQLTFKYVSNQILTKNEYQFLKNQFFFKKEYSQQKITEQAWILKRFEKLGCKIKNNLGSCESKNSLTFYIGRVNENKGTLTFGHTYLVLSDDSNVSNEDLVISFNSLVPFFYSSLESISSIVFNEIYIVMDVLQEIDMIHSYNQGNQNLTEIQLLLKNEESKNKLIEEILNQYLKMSSNHYYLENKIELEDSTKHNYEIISNNCNTKLHQIFLNSGLIKKSIKEYMIGNPTLPSQYFEYLNKLKLVEL